jgi:hypothetical protein
MMFTKYLYLGAALALAAVLSFTHFTAYRAGKGVIRAEWTASVAQANKELRALENRRQDRADEAAGLAATRQARIVADAAGARRESAGLRDDLNAVQRHAAQSLAAATVTVAALSSVFEECTRRYLDVAEAADRATSDALTLQQAWPE